jgi:type IV fimbrial biogenesis protein FimT
MQRGFTIIELMTVVVIVGILATIGAPSLRDFVIRNRVKTASTDLHFTLTFARSEAVKRNAQVDVVPVSTSDWSQGWSVRVNGTTDNLASYQAYENVTFAARDATCTSAAAVSTVSFLGTGRTTSANGNCFVLTATGYATIRARCIMISPSGRPNVRFDNDADPSDGCA